MPLLAFIFLTQNEPASSLPVLLYLCHRRQDLVAVAVGTDGVAAVLGDKAVLQTWSEDWYVTAEAPTGYVPPTPAVWHARIDQAPLSVERCQAGYQPSIIGVGVGDRRRAAEMRTRITVEGWPIYVDGARGLTDALAKAKSRWVDPIYSAGRPMTLDEWIAYTGFRKVKPDWFEPAPLPWAGFSFLNAYHTVTWRQLPLATNAPYDASINPSPMRSDESAHPEKPPSDTNDV